MSASEIHPGGAGRRTPGVSLFRKIVAGGPGRATRLHSETGECISLREFLHLPRAVASWSLRRVTGRRPEEPWWPIPVIPRIARLLTPESRVLEFGSGSSTVWLARHAKSVVSVEDDPAWHRSVTGRLATLGLPNATVCLAQGEAYYDLSWAEERFDLVVVDGSYRWRCIEAALPLLKPGGALYFDNSDADKDLLLYPEPGMRRVAAAMLESYAADHPAARLERYTSFISSELHVGEGMLLTNAERGKTTGGEAAGAMHSAEGAVAPAVSVAMLGARMHYAVPRLLNDAGLLKSFFTDSYIGNKPWLEWALKRAPARLRPAWVRRWLGRRDGELPPEKVVSFDAFGMWYAAARRRVRSREHADRLFDRAAVAFNRRVIGRGLAGADVLWGYNTASLEAFQVARKAGLRCVLEQTMLPLRLEGALLEEEEARWPGWSLKPSAEIGSVLAAREEAEWDLADRIVAGSVFVRDGLLRLGVPAGRIVVIPYGVDPAQFPVRSPTTSVDDPRLKVLFVGQAGLRKGIPDLLQAIARIAAETITVRVAGRVAIAPERLAAVASNISFLGALPRSDIARLLEWADVLVLPSIVEGSATVTYEALMSGRPVIATPNAGSIVRSGVDGFVVPIRDPEALAGALGRYVGDRRLLAAHQEAAAAGRERAGVARYGADIVRTIREIA